MSATAGELAGGRPKRLATALLLLVTLLLVLGAFGADSIDVFTDLEVARTPEGREYLVAQHRSFLPFEDEGFVYLHRGADGERWSRTERRSGRYAAATAAGDRLLVFHGAGYSLYRGGERVEYETVALDWTVQAAAARDGEVLLVGQHGEAIECATLAGPAIRYSRALPPAPLRVLRVRIVAAGEGWLVFWNQREPAEFSGGTLFVAPVEGGRIGEPRRVRVEDPVEDFDVVRSGEDLRVVYLAGEDDDRSSVLVAARFADDALVDRLRLETPGDSFLPDRWIGLAAETRPDGTLRIYASTFGSIQAFDVAEGSSEARRIDLVAGLSSFARERVLLWLSCLGMLSFLLLVTGVYMFQSRIRLSLARLAAEPEPPPMTEEKERPEDGPEG